MIPANPIVTSEIKTSINSFFPGLFFFTIIAKTVPMKETTATGKAVQASPLKQLAKVWMMKFTIVAIIVTVY